MALQSGAILTAGWTTAVEIDLRIGGANVSHNAKFAIFDAANVPLLYQFQNAVKEYLKQRLASMLETVEAMFQLCNMGVMKIDTIDQEGHYYWDFAGDKHHAFIDSSGTNNKSTR